MPDLSVEDVKAILVAQGIADFGDIGEEELVETTRRLNALMDGLDRMEESGAFGDADP